MCEFHLKGQCFHPERAKRGLVATSCTVHDCSDCTNKTWQKTKLEENYAYYQSILILTQDSAKNSENEESDKPFLTKIFSTIRN